MDSINTDDNNDDEDNDNDKDTDGQHIIQIALSLSTVGLQSNLVFIHIIFLLWQLSYITTVI